jgi:DNA repair exonuclease SbcCD ATPase subunit
MQEVERKLAACADLAGASAQFPQLVSEVRSLEAEDVRLSAAEASLNREEQPLYPLVRNLCAAAAAVLLGGAAGAAGAVLPNAVLLIAGAAIGFGGLIAAALFTHFSRRSAAQSGGQTAALKRVEADLARTRSDLNTARAGLLREVEGRVEFKEAALDDLLARYWERRRLEARAEALGNAVMRPEKLAELRARSAETVREIAVLDERIESRDGQLAAGGNQGEGEERRLVARADELTRAVENASAALQDMRVELAGLQSSASVAAATGDRLEQLEELIPRHEARCLALRLARSELSASINEFQEKHLESLGEVAGELLERLTRGRYAGVTVDAESLLPTVSGGGREGLEDAVLSQGTRAALYLALRLAMGKLVSGGRTLPLILDDPLVDLDDGRRAAALELLGELSGATQVILLSCDRRLTECGAKVLDLGVEGARSGG